MYGYFDYFPEKRKTELRTMTIVEEGTGDSIPVGTYIFTEYFCTDSNCDCQRVLVKVFRALSEHSRPEEVATISYTWDEGTDGLWAEVASEMPNPFLDPFHRQVRYAQDLVDFWEAMVDRDPAYKARLQRHYHELRAAFRGPSATTRPAVRVDPTQAVAPPTSKQQRRARRRQLGEAMRRRKDR